MKYPQGSNDDDMYVCIAMFLEDFAAQDHVLDVAAARVRRKTVMLNVFG